MGVGVIIGNNNTNPPTINPLGNATRAEVAAMMEKYCKKVEMRNESFEYLNTENKEITVNDKKYTISYKIKKQHILMNLNI